MSNHLSIQHDPAGHRFFTIVDNSKECILEYREVDPTTLEYFHTFVPDELRGQGIAGKLAEYALDWALKHHKKIVPTCSYVMQHIAKNKRFRDLVS